jgi:hypothetical protein
LIKNLIPLVTPIGHRTWKNHTPGHGAPADDARPHNEAVKTRRALQKDLAIEGAIWRLKES